MPLFAGLGLFFVVVAFAQVLKMSDAVTGLGISSSELLMAFIYSLPPLMGMLLPVSLLFATLLAIGRIANDRELIGLCAGGISPYRLLRVPFWLAALLATLSLAALVEGEPWGIGGLRSLMARSAQRALTQGVHIGQFTEWVPGVTFLARDKVGHDLIDVVFADRRGRKEPIVVSARRGQVLRGDDARDIVFDLRDGNILLPDEKRNAYRTIEFEQSYYLLDVGKIVRNKAQTVSSVQEKDLAELWEGTKSAASANKRALHAILLHRKAALPVATIIFAVLAVPLACQRTGGARARSFLYSSAIVGCYYYLGRAMELYARGGRLDPGFAAWLPNIIGVLAAGVMVWRFKKSAL